MLNYLVDKKYIPKKYIELSIPDGYTFKPQIKTKIYIKVNKVNIVDRTMIDRILTAKYEKSFKQLVSLALKVLNDEDATESDTEIVLGEVELVREILQNRYEKYISYEKVQLFFKKLNVIENEIRIKQIQIKRKIMLMNMQEELNVSRGR